MKQLFAFVLLALALSFGEEASAQQRRFYYYPASNVYYDVANKTYIYPYNGTWVTRSALPSRTAVLGTNRVTVYSQSSQVWRQNATHRAKYKGKSAGAPYGKAVGYKGSNTNKAQGKTVAPKGKATASKGKSRGKH